MKLAVLVHDVANALTAIDSASWALVGEEAGRGFGVDMRSTAGEVVNFQESTSYARPRFWIEGMDPVTPRATECAISVLASRGAVVIAREIERRLLGRLRAELASRREKETAERAEFEARTAAVRSVAGLFGPCDVPESYDPAHRAPYTVEAWPALRGRHERQAGRYVHTDREWAHVSATGDGSLMSLEARNVPAAVVLRMARVLADYNAMLPEPEPGREDRVAGEGGTAAEPSPFSAAFEKLYDEYLYGGHSQRMPWEDFLSRHLV